MGARAVTAAIQNMATFAGLSGEEASHFSAYSLRIGGATAMMVAGCTTEQIRANGGWKSDAVMQYLRVRQLAAQGLSSQMGFAQH